MLDEVGAAAEGLATIGAHIGLLCVVDGCVFHQCKAALEQLATFSAHERLLTAVDDLVLDEVGAAREALAALLARVALFVALWGLGFGAMGSPEPGASLGGTVTLLCRQSYYRSQRASPKACLWEVSSRRLGRVAHSLVTCGDSATLPWVSTRWLCASVLRPEWKE